MSPNIPHYYANLFHRVIEKFTIDFIVFEAPFYPREEVSFMEEQSGIFKLNTVPNSLNKCAFSKPMINIFNILIAKMTLNREIYLSRRDKVTSREGIPNNQPKEKFNLRKEI